MGIQQLLQVGGRLLVRRREVERAEPRVRLCDIETRGSSNEQCEQRAKRSSLSDQTVFAVTVPDSPCSSTTGFLSASASRISSWQNCKSTTITATTSVGDDERIGHQLVLGSASAADDARTGRSSTPALKNSMKAALSLTPFRMPCHHAHTHSISRRPHRLLQQGAHTQPPPTLRTSFVRSSARLSYHALKPMSESSR